MKTAIVIPARFASERFPGKPLAPIAGVPMIVHVWRNMRVAELADEVIVATDDERIADAVRCAGGLVAMTDPGLPSGSDRVWAAICHRGFDVVVNVQGDEPLLPGSVVDELITALRDRSDFDIATPVVREPRARAASPDVVTVACAESGAALYFSRQTVPHGAEDVWRHIGVYAYRHAALRRFVEAVPADLERSERLEQLRALSIGLKIVAVPVDVRLHAVDRPADIARVERIMRGEPEAASIRAVVLDVDGVLTNGAIAYLNDGQQLLVFDVKDGHGIKLLQRAGIKVAVASGRDSPALRHRCRELGIEHGAFGVDDKAAALRDLCVQLGVDLEEVCYVGDDVPDLAAFALAGMSACPADAVAEVKVEAQVVLQAGGGHGAVRELAVRMLEKRRSTP